MSLQPRDTTYTKIFVGGLPYHTTDATLRDYFAVFGTIEEAVVITDRQTGKSRGYGFVTMTDKSSAERACKDPNPVIDGRKANVNLAYIGAKPRIIQPTVAAIRQIPQSYLSNTQFTGTIPSIYAQYPTQSAAAYVTPSGVLIPAQAAQHPSQIIDYSGVYANAFQGTYPAEVATATAPYATAYGTTALHASPSPLGVNGGAVLATTPHQAGIPVPAAYTGLAGYHPATTQIAPGYAGVATSPLPQASPVPAPAQLSVPLQAAEHF